MEHGCITDLDELGCIVEDLGSLVLHLLGVDLGCLGCLGQVVLVGRNLGQADCAKRVLM